MGAVQGVYIRPIACRAEDGLSVKRRLNNRPRFLCRNANVLAQEGSVSRYPEWTLSIAGPPRSLDISSNRGQTGVKRGTFLRFAFAAF
jgi:hypothetical protein